MKKIILLIVISITISSCSTCGAKKWRKKRYVQNTELNTELNTKEKWS